MSGAPIAGPGPRGGSCGRCDAGVTEVRARVEALRAMGVTGPIPVDLVTKSASGLDPHVSRAAAAIQVPRVARARSMSEDAVRSLVAAHTEGSTLGMPGEPRVDVLELNLALDAQDGRTP